MWYLELIADSIKYTLFDIDAYVHNVCTGSVSLQAT